ncbi:dopamine receptor 1-like [Limulus polyphemus]|uniref:Dopamine receptor 1-like n=1 Tax=Limulus polyphemus TaxID=6850 RepID=A0ABM1B783_LIMPO|nr:dopamine receptor 1-like [Limulus polyphemus]
MEDWILILNSSRTFNHTSPQDRSRSVPDLTYKCLVGAFLGFIIFFSVAGNLLVCLAIYRDRRLRKLGNLFLVSLAVSDLFVSSLVMTFAVVNDLMGYWMFGPQFCDTWVAFDVMCCTASILNLCSVSFDRFVHIKDPLRYNCWMTKRVVLGSICLIWLLSALVSFLPISLGWHKPKNSVFAGSLEKERPTCALELTPVYAVVSSSISFFAPCVVMIALYARLYLYARKHVKNIRATEPVCDVRSSNSHHSSHVREHKASITLGIIVGVFLVCWVPFFSVNIVAAFCKSCISDLVWKCLTWLGYFNSTLNPVIYSIFNAEFRDAFRKILFSKSPETSCTFWTCCRGCQLTSPQPRVSRYDRKLTALHKDHYHFDLDDQGKMSQV